MGRDQNDTAARVVHAGAGVRLAPSAPAARITRAVQTVLGDPADAAAASRLKQALATPQGCVDAVAELGQLARARAAAARGVAPTAELAPAL